MLETIVTDYILIHMQFHALHSNGTLISVFRMARTVGVGNGQGVNLDGIERRSIDNTVFFDLSK